MGRHHVRDRHPVVSTFAGVHGMLSLFLASDGAAILAERPTAVKRATSLFLSLGRNCTTLPGRSAIGGGIPLQNLLLCRRMPATPTTKKGLHTRSKILDAAARVFGQDGYVEARMVDIAAEAKLSTGGLYRYFDNKSEVFAALIANLHEEFYDYSGHTRQLLGENPLAALTEANRGYIDHYHRNRHVMRALVEAASVEDRFSAILHEMRKRHVRRFVRTYRGLTGRSEVRGVAVETMTEALACMVEQCCYVWFALDEDFDESTSVDDAVRATSQAWFATMFA